MTYEVGKLGGTTNVTKNVATHYGPRNVGRYTGSQITVGLKKELVLNFTAEDVSNGSFALFGDVIIPKGAVLTSALFKVDEVFALGGTTPSIVIGTKGSEATNGVSVDEASAEALGIYDISGTAAGTWASPFTADTIVGVTLDGTTPTVGTGGKAELTLLYTLIN